MDVLDVAPVGPTARDDIEPFLERVARSHAEKRIALIDDGEETVQADRVEVIAQLHEALSEAAAEAKLDRKHGALQDRPRTHLLEAAKQVRKAGEAFLRVKSRNDFKIEAFKAARADLTGALASLDILIAADGK